MKAYIGTKIIGAIAMSRLDYNKLRGWELPKDENGEDSGYLVEYRDGGKPNHPDYDGYISWSPKEQFENAYQPLDEMDFSHALNLLKLGYRVARRGWNGKGMWVLYINSSDYDVVNNSVDDLDLSSWLGMKTADGNFVPWLASQSDLLASDWSLA